MRIEIKEQKFFFISDVFAKLRRDRPQISKTIKTLLSLVLSAQTKSHFDASPLT